MSLKLPKISIPWAVAIVVACLMAGGVSVLMLVPPTESSHRPLTVSVVEEGAASTAASNITTEESVAVKQVKYKKDVELKEKEPSGGALALEEKHVASPDPLILPANGSNPSEINIVNVSQDDLTQEKALPKEEEPQEKDPTTPYYNSTCLEKRADGMLLPVESPEGLRPFDVYQETYTLDPAKTSLTLIVSELGGDKPLFEQLKTSFPREVVCAFLASRRLSGELNKEARELGHETLLMLPMEPMNYPKSDPGPKALLTNLKVQENQKRLEIHLSQFTGYLAVTPYMGNRFSRVKRDFQPILKEVKRRGLGYFEPRLVRSKARQWKSDDLSYAKGHYDIVRGTSVAKIRKILAKVKAELAQKHSLILTVQADKISLREVQQWLPKVLSDTVVLAPLSAVTE